jgi:hypothetical protein
MKKTRTGLSVKNRRTMIGVAPPSSGSAPAKPSVRYRLGPRQKKLIDLAESLGSPSSAISRTFDLVEICEEEIARSASPEKISFLALRPTDGMTGIADGVYRSHCRELIARMMADESLEPGTAAECLLVVSRTSLIAPLGQTANAVAHRLFREVFGVPVVEDGYEPSEAWAGAADEEIRTLRRKLSRPRLEKSA